MKRMIAWFAENGVAANLLMVTIIVGGLLTIFSVRQEVFPEIEPGLITVSVLYPGAAPEEVESGVTVRIEEALEGIEGVEEVSSVSAEGLSSVTVDMLEEADPSRVLDDVKTRVDAIDTFPEEIEQPTIQEVVVRRQVVNIAISGDVPERTLKRIGERVRDEVALLPNITQVELAAVRPDEIAIEVSEQALRRYGLSFSDVANAVRRASLDLPGGTLRTDGGEILLRTEGQAYVGLEFEKLPLLTRPDGSRLTVGDVATVVDGFAETDQAARFDGEPAVLVQVFRIGDQSALDIAEQVKAYVAEADRVLPDGIELTIWQDDTQVLRSRLDLLIRNGRTGLFLVLLVLALFLRVRLAGWVALGIPISFLGAFALMPTLDVTINLISLFAFLVVLGIVVDDAIIVGENIYRRFQEGEEKLEAAINGAQEMAIPVTFAILTTIAAFSPLLGVTGTTGQIMRVIPLIVIAVLIFSLVESLLVLPNHLSHMSHAKEDARDEVTEGESKSLSQRWRGFQDAFARQLQRFTDKVYAPQLDWAVDRRYLTAAIAVALLVVTGGLVAGGWISFTFFPPVEADNAVAILTMPNGTASETTAQAVTRIEQAALDLRDELEEETGAPVFRHVLATTGEQPFSRDQSQGGPGGGGSGVQFSGSNLGEVNIELMPAEERTISSSEIAERWRRKTGPVPGAEELSFTSSLFSAGDDVNVQFSGPSLEALEGAAEALKSALARYPGVEDITDSFRAGKDEIKVDVTPEAQALGLSLADVALQVRQAFYGEEVQRIQRGRDEVKIMVRYPERQRRSVGDLEDLRIRAPGGVSVPFPTAGTAEMGTGFATIQRSDRRRTVSVTADVDPARGNANEILAAVEAEVLPGILADHPGVRYSFEGEQEEQRKTIQGLTQGFSFALLIIYVLLAVPFRSYVQPLIVMSAIPFGLIGAIGGHFLMGINLTILSGFGMVALTGVVVNDSLVMVDFINRRYRGGMPLAEAIRESGKDRLRPILLTSLTTFVGLTPLLLEQSVQAQFLIPMAVSLAFGVLFATLVTLLLVPVLYRIVVDAQRGTRSLLGMEPRRPGTGELAAEAGE